jgi:hypothetical protein
MISQFTPSGKSIVLTYADDSTNVSTAVTGATAFLVFNPDIANVIVFNTGFTDNDVDAVIPTSGQNGFGTVVGPQQQVVLQYPQSQTSQGPVYISVAGVSGTGSVYITPGVA